ncbi:MAG: sulfatase-like hydrolase/transferase, partial [Planctomycetes bacterium]|nr:sulfatase-like hydrolase/transferase [Planctomycetota bacterium]
FRPFGRGFDAFPLPAPGGPRSAAEGCALALEALTRPGTADTPCFVWLHFMEVHGPWDHAEGRFGAEDIDLYDDAIATCDAAIGELLESLKESGADENLMVVLLGDHGEEFGEHGGRFHGSTLYEECLRVPLLIHLPRQSRGLRIRRDTELVDLVPTLEDLLELAPGLPHQGETLLPDFLESRPPTPAFSLAQLSTPFGGRFSSAIHDGWKAIRDELSGHTVCFDLDTDPRELRPRGPVDESGALRPIIDLLDAASIFAREIPDRPGAELAPGPAVLDVVAAPGPSGPPVDASILRAHAGLTDSRDELRRATYFALDPIERMVAARALLAEGGWAPIVWLRAGLLDPQVEAEWAPALVSLLGEAEDPLSLALCNELRDRGQLDRALDDQILSRMVRAPGVIGEVEYLARRFHSTFGQARLSVVAALDRADALPDALDAYPRLSQEESKAAVPPLVPGDSDPVRRAPCPSGAAELVYGEWMPRSANAPSARPGSRRRVQLVFAGQQFPGRLLAQDDGHWLMVARVPAGLLGTAHLVDAAGEVCATFELATSD